MKGFSAQALLLCISAVLPTAWTATVDPAGTCLGSDQEVQTIAQRWLDAFATGGIKGLPAAATKDIHIYDEGAQNGSVIPYVQNYQDLEKTINASAYGGGGVTNVTYNILFTFNTCHRIALRWQETAYTTDNIGFNSTVGAFKKIQFKGTDLLTIDLHTKKVMNATTSGDLLNYYRALGYPLGVWTAPRELPPGKPISNGGVGHKMV